MAATGTVTINIIGDASKLKNAVGEGESALSRFGDKVQASGEKIMSFGAKMTIGVTAPLALLGKQAFDAASDLNESLSKVGVVFEGFAFSVIAWSTDAATAMGISQQAALEAAGTFGNLFRALGIGLPTATDMSEKLVQLASDLASFNNANPEDVLLALRSGLVGEVEPLRKFGVSLSADRVQAKALELGLYDVAGATEASVKAQAAYAIILEDTKLAQGDFARTADGAANKQRILSAQFKDLEAKLGQALLPIFLEVAQALQKIGDWFSNLDPKWQKLIVYAGLALAAIGPLTTAIGGLVTVIGVLISPITLLVIAIAAVAAAIVLMWLKWNQIWNFIKDHPAIGIVVAILAAPVAALFLIIGAVKYLYENWSTIWPEIQNILQRVWDAIGPVMRAIADAAVWIDEKTGELADAIRDAWPTIQRIIEGVWDAVKPILDGYVTVLQYVIDKITWLADHAAGWWNAFKDGLIVAWAAIQPVLEGMLRGVNDIIAAIRTLLGLFKNTTVTDPNQWPDWAGPLPGGASGTIGTGPNGEPLFGAASGGYFRSRPGGYLVNLAEGGEDEVVMPVSKMRGYGGVNVSIGQIVAADPESAVDVMIRRLRTESFLAGMN